MSLSRKSGAVRRAIAAATVQAIACNCLKGTASTWSHQERVKRVRDAGRGDFKVQLIASGLSASVVNRHIRNFDIDTSHLDYKDLYIFVIAKLNGFYLGKAEVYAIHDIGRDS